MRRKALLIAFVLLVPPLVVAGAWMCSKYLSEPDDSAQEAHELLCMRTPVPSNRGTDVPDGFRGEVHPLLHRHAQLEVQAHWDGARIDDRLHPGIPAEVRRLYMEVRAAVPRKSYSERDFSGFLPPEGITDVGKMWALDVPRVREFLTQFHPAVSMHSGSVGRRPGPDGAFALLQGVSASYLDIAFRFHAEFDLTPMIENYPALYVWYSPAYFYGRIVVNRDSGTVEYFQISVPTESASNVHGTVWTTQFLKAYQTHHIHQFLRANRMELLGGSLKGLEGVQWTARIETAQVKEKLVKVFYKFREIDFVPFTRALATARAQKKPIFAIILLGTLDDQSC